MSITPKIATAALAAVLLAGCAGDPDLSPEEKRRLAELSGGPPDLTKV